jgi:hypothetical protein
MIIDMSGISRTTRADGNVPFVLSKLGEVAGMGLV